MTQEPAVRLSSMFFWISRAALILLPLAVVAALVAQGGPRASVLANYPELQVSDTLSDGLVWLALCIGLLNAAAMYVALWQAHRLFGFGRAGQSLTAPAALAIHRIGLALLAAALLSVVTRPAQGLVLTSANPPGERVLSITLNSSDLALLMASGLLLMIGAVLRAAVEIAEDHARIV